LTTREVLLNSPLPIGKPIDIGWDVAPTGLPQGTPVEDGPLIILDK
jgi:hypothetical protein